MRKQNLILVGTLIVLDTLMIVAGWSLAYQLRIGGDVLPYYYTANPDHYRNVVLFSLPIWILVFALCRLYDRDELLGGPQEYGNIVKGCLIGLALLVMVSLFIRTPDLARGWFVIGWLLTTIFVGVARFLTRRVFYSLRRQGWFVQRALIVGTNDDARAIARQLTPVNHTGVEVVGFVDDYLPVNTPVEQWRVVGVTPNLPRVTRELNIDQVILVSGAMAWESFDHLLRGITLAAHDRYAIKVSPGLYETLTTGVRVSYKNRVPLLEIERAPITGIDALLKGALDQFIAWLALLIALPFMGLIALVLWALGRRPLIEASPVVGKNGDSFNTFLFSAQRPGSEPWKRGSGFGKFLYETGLEKLPQLWNVVRGKMSLVGPRPMDPRYTSAYEEWLPNLLSLKPGMTGARASSAQNVITLDQEMRLELYYARNYSIWLDLQILFQTFVRIIKRERIVRQAEPETVRTHSPWQHAAVLPSQH